MWNKRILIHCYSYFKRMSTHQYSECTSICGPTTSLLWLCAGETCRYVHPKLDCSMVYNNQKRGNNLHSDSKRIDTCMLSHFSPVQLFVTLQIVAHQAPLSMGFSRQEYRSGLLCPPPGESSRPRDGTRVSYVACDGRQVLYHWCHLGSPRSCQFQCK